MTPTKRDGIDCFETMVYGYPGQEEEEVCEVLSAFREIPAIQLGIEQGALQLETEHITEQMMPTAGKAKRRTIDNRPE
jgi:hypothetical protein